MPPRSSNAKADTPPARPAYYVATVDLYQGAAVDLMPVCAFRAGHHVPVDLYDSNPEWQQWLAEPGEEAEAASAAEETAAPGGAQTGAGAGQGEE